MPESSLRVLFFSHCHSMRGGAARSLLELLQRLPRDRFDPLVVVPKTGEFSAECDAIGVRCRFCPSVWWVTEGTMDTWLYGLRRLPTAVDRVREIIRTEGIQLVHSNSAVAPAGAMAACLERIPHVWHVREIIQDGATNFSGGAASLAQICKLIVQLSTHTIAISDAVANPLSAPEKVSVVYDGIDWRRFEGCMPSGGTRVVSIGATTKAKGLDDLLTVAELLKPQHAEIRFDVVGRVEPPDYARHVKARVRRLGLDDFVSLHGFQADIVPYLERARVCLVPSRSEGMSRVVLEAMAAGLPVVATGSGGPSELVIGGQTGVLCRTGDVQAMADAVARLLGDVESASGMGRKGRERVHAEFDNAVSARRIATVLADAAKGRPSSADAAMAFLLEFVREAGPRLLLGKKWKLLKRFL